MPFCYSPWTNIDISPTGRISPCCKFQVARENQYTIQNNSVDDYINSEFLNNIKLNFNEGTWPSGCERCSIEETNGIKSKRILDYERWSSYYKTVDLSTTKFITASVAFGNTCNLKCISCGAHSSSRWYQEYKDIYKIDIPHFDFYKENFVEEFIKLAPEIVHIDIPGGEPLLSGVKQQKELLKHYIDTKQSSNITLHYTTNGTIFPDEEWWKLWKHFKEIDLQLSVDGINQRYEYIRFPADWNVFVSNTMQYLTKENELDNLRLSISHTVSAYNIYYLDEFFTWCKQQGLPTPWLGRVHNPAHMRPTIWPNSFKVMLIEHLLSSQYPEVQNWARIIDNVDDSDQYELFCHRVKEHDQYRGTIFSNVFADLADWIK